MAYGTLRKVSRQIRQRGQPLNFFGIDQLLQIQKSQTSPVSLTHCSMQRHRHHGRSLLAPLFCNSTNPLDLDPTA